MVITEPAEVTASETGPPGFRIRWGWFLGCIASGLAAIVVLLERRIVDNAVKKFRNAAEEARAKIRDDFRIQVHDFTDRVNVEWAAASREDVDAMKERTKRLSNKLADN